MRTKDHRLHSLAVFPQIMVCGDGSKGTALRRQFVVGVALLAIAASPANAAQVIQAAPTVEPEQTDQVAPAAGPGQAALDQAPPQGEIIVTARRRAESAQDAAVAVSVVSGETIDRTGSFNVNRLQQLQPSLQFYSSNPRNTAVNIRGIGAPFGLTNDGIEQGVGIYIDDVYYARVAASTFDFLDVERIEVLRGPQGTLYGKNTTAGALNITTRRPSFTPEGSASLSVGNLGYVQGKAAVSGPLSSSVAARLVGSVTRRDGTLRNTFDGKDVNQIDNLGLRGQLLWRATDRLDLTLAADYNRQNPRCCGQVFVRVAPTLRPLNRQYEALAAGLNYSLASRDPFDRRIDHDTDLAARQVFGGVSLRAEWEVGQGTLTSVSAWRAWDWKPSNDRDFTLLPITTISANPSHQTQRMQEVRYNSRRDGSLDFGIGLFLFDQRIKSTGLQEQGSAASYWLLGPTAGRNPALLDGLRQESDIDYRNKSAALFGRLTWEVLPGVKIEPGLRLNYDRKSADYAAVVTGGLATSDPVLIARKNGVLQSQAYTSSFSDWNVSGDLTVSYKPSRDILLYATYARSFKSGGVNLSGIPARADGTPATELATVDPERIDHFELGAKTEFWGRRARANVALFRTGIDDYQATVVNGAIGVLRGYLANAEKVRSQGVELDLSVQPVKALRLNANIAYTDAKYVRFRDAPPPLELSGGTIQVVDISGQRLPGVSKWALSYGAEYSVPARIHGIDGSAFVAVDGNVRSRWSSSPSPSDFMFVDGYNITNARIGLRAARGWEVQGWVRNLFDAEYFDFLNAQSGSTGLIVGQPGDPRTYGVTTSVKF